MGLLQNGSAEALLTLEFALKAANMVLKLNAASHRSKTKTALQSLERWCTKNSKYLRVIVTLSVT